jgi:hypothetical protein
VLLHAACCVVLLHAACGAVLCCAMLQARKGARVHSFYTMPEYESWKEGLGAAGTSGWDIKYYKGLVGLVGGGVFRGRGGGG